MYCASAQFALYTVRWPCIQKLKYEKVLCHGKTFILRLFFLCSFRMKTLELVSHLFYGTKSIFGTPKIVQNNPGPAYLEFESQGFLGNHVFLPTE